MPGEPGRFSFSSSKFRTNHGEVDFYLHTFARSKIAPMRPFSKRRRGRSSKQLPFKGNLIPFFFPPLPFGRDSNFDHAKVPVKATPPPPLRGIGALGPPKETLQSIRADFTPLVSAAFAFFHRSTRRTRRTAFSLSGGGPAGFPRPRPTVLGAGPRRVFDVKINQSPRRSGRASEKVNVPFQESEKKKKPRRGQEARVP